MSKNKGASLTKPYPQNGREMAILRLQKERDELNMKLRNDRDFINLKRYDYSAKKLRMRYPEGAPDHIVAAALALTENEAKAEFRRIVEILKRKINTEKS